MSKLRILVVDDNRPAADTLALYLELEGLETETAYDGAEAVKKAGASHFDLIILDIGMPHLDGCQAAREIAAQAPGKPPLLVALSGWNQEKDLARTREAGFAVHLVKPVEPDYWRTLLVSLGLQSGA